MATRTISNAGGFWANAGTWVEGAAPTSADEVVATATSGNVTIAAAASCRSIDLTGYTGTLTHNATRTLTIGDGTAPTGNNALVFPSSGWTYTLGNATSSAISFASTSATQLNVNFGGKTCGNVTFNGVGGTWKLTGNLVSSGTLTLTNGTFDGNGYDVTVASLSSSNANTRTLTMGGGQWTITGNSATVFTISTATNLTFTRGTLPIILNYSGSSGTRTVTSSSAIAESSAPSFKVTAGSDVVDLANRFYNLTFDGFTGSFGTSARDLYGNLLIAAASSSMSFAGGPGITFAATSGTQTISASTSLATAITVNSPGATVQLLTNIVLTSQQITLTAGTFDANGYAVTIANFSSSNSNVRSLKMGSGTWTLNGSTVWNTSTTTNMTLDRGTASVVLDPGGNKTLSMGGLSVYNLSMVLTGTARTLTFTDGQTAGATNSLTLTGSSGQLLTLKGSSTGGWTLAVPATQSISYVSVSRSTATGNTAAAGSTSTDGGNNVNWTFGGTPGTAPVNTVAPSVTPSNGIPATSFAFNAGTWTGTTGYPITYTWTYRKSGAAAWLTLSNSQNPTIAGTVFGTQGTYDTQVTARNDFGSTTVNGPSITLSETRPGVVNPMGFFGL